MKISSKKIIMLALTALATFSVAAPAHADWYDGRHYHRGHLPPGYIWDPRAGYYIYQPGVVVAAPPPVIVAAQPAPPPVVIAQPAPQVIYAQPAPVYAEPAPVGLSLGVHIR